MPKNIIIFFGPPGSGKGTQAEMLAKATCLPACLPERQAGKAGWKKISTGDLFRAEIAAKTALGKSVDKYLKAGKLVPDKVTINLVKKSLKAKASGFIFDGFPRTRRQLKELLGFLKIFLRETIEFTRLKWW